MVDPEVEADSPGLEPFLSFEPLVDPVDVGITITLE